MTLAGPLPRKALALGVLLTAAAAGLVAGREAPAPQPERSAPASAPLARPAPAVEIELAKLERVAAAAPRSDPFAPRQFNAPVSPPQAASAPQVASAPRAPSAPPLPFAYFGRLTENGKTEVFVTRGEELISIAPGRKIDPEYRVDAIGASSISFTYLPMKARQHLDLGEAGG